MAEQTGILQAAQIQISNTDCENTKNHKRRQSNSKKQDHELSFISFYCILSQFIDNCFIIVCQHKLTFSPCSHLPHKSSLALTAKLGHPQSSRFVLPSVQYPDHV